MKAIVLSDTHGSFPSNSIKSHFDILIHCGDFLPDIHSSWNVTPKFVMDNQIEWLEEKAPFIKKILGERKLLFTLGNHDFVPGHKVEEILQKYKISALCLHDKITSVENVNFYGFPYIPPIDDSFAYESEPKVMTAKINQLKNVISKTYIDVIVAHCPPKGYLDKAKNGNSYGNQHMTDFLKELPADWEPQYYLSGHIHEDHSITRLNTITVINSATVQTKIEI